MNIQTIKVDDNSGIRPFIGKLHIPASDSHKGQNGKALVIGGSSLFHAAPVWAACTASIFVDMVHLASIDANIEVVQSLKKSFWSGMVVPQSQIGNYLKEDDVALIGSGMMRTDEKLKPMDDYNLKDIESLADIEDEGSQTYHLTKYLLQNFPNKKWVIDAGALQMMSATWLKDLTIKPVLTPHQGEFERLFGVDISHLEKEQKIEVVARTASEYNCIILLKAVIDIASDGETTVVIEGGNAGLTRGGSGDALAGICAGLFARSDGLTASICASYLLKKAASELYKEYGYWYTIEDIIHQIGRTMQVIRQEIT